MILGLLYFLSLSAWAQVQPFNYVELMNLLPETTEYKTTNIYQQNPRLHRDRVQALLPAIRNNQSLYQTNADTYAGHMQRLHGKNTDRVKQMSRGDLTELRGILLRYDCARSLPSGAPTNCSGNNQSRMVPLTDHEKRLLLPLGFTNAELDGQLNDENREKFTHLLYQTDFQLQTQRLKDAQVRAQEAIAHYNQQQADAENRQGQISQACQSYLRGMEGKVASPAAANSSQKMPTRISSQQARPYIEGLHRAHQEAQALSDAEERITRIQELRNAAEILSCNGHRSQIAQLVPQLENSLRESLFTGNNECNNAEQSDRLYSARSTCVAGFLDALPSGRGEFVANVEQVNLHLQNLDPHGVLGQIQADQSKQAEDNLAYMNALYDLGAGQKASLPEGTRTSSDCGGVAFTHAKEAYGNFIRSLSSRNQFTALSTEQRQATLSQELGQFVESLSQSYPGFGGLAYSPAFLSSYNLNLENMEIEENSPSCSDVKSGMHQALTQSIHNIKNPPRENTADQTIARASQKTKRFLADLVSAETMGLVNIPTASHREIDQLYREIPQLANYPRHQIYNLKSLLRYRPEMRAHYMRQFEGNSRLICYLYKASEKDEMREAIVQKEVKFVKGVAKAVGTAVTFASYFVNPALGMVLTAAAAGATGTYHTMNIGNLENQLNNATMREAATLNQCIENMMRSPSSNPTLARSQCASAVATAQDIARLTASLEHASAAAKQDAVMYLVYMASLAPDALKHFNAQGLSGVSHSLHEAMDAFKAAKSTGGANALGQMLKTFATTEAHHYAHGAVGALYGLSKSAKLYYYTTNAPYSAYMVKYGSAAKVGYQHYLTDERVRAEATRLGRSLNEQEFHAIESQVESRVAHLSESEILSHVNNISLN